MDNRMSSGLLTSLRQQNLLVIVPFQMVIESWDFLLVIEQSLSVRSESDTDNVLQRIVSPLTPTAHDFS